MNVINHTPFPAQVFQAVDQHEQRFDVFVLRQTLSFATGTLEYSDTQTPLCAADEYFGENMTGGLRQESDFCPYKPNCDVIVNAVAYAPQGKATTDFLVNLRVIRGSILHGTRLIDKMLRVSGERHFKKRAWPLRILQRCISLGTLTLIRPNPWKLTRPKLFAALSLHDALAYGGECKIKQNDQGARRVPKQYRLTPEQQMDHPDAQLPAFPPPIAHAVFESNPAGVGFAPCWYLKASARTAIPAPRIERPKAQLTAKQFWLSQYPARKNKPHIEPACLGIRPKSHPARRVLLGTVTGDFSGASAALPQDFDFGIWNAAQPDQQIDFPIGNEIIELINLCPHDLPGTYVNDRANSVVHLTLPTNECFVLLRHDDGTLSALALTIDTILIEPEECRLVLVWRRTLSQGDIKSTRAAEFRMRTFLDRDIARISPAFQQKAWVAVGDTHVQAIQP